MATETENGGETDVGGGGAALPTRADPALVKALMRAFRYQRMLDEGRYASISEMATAERIERGYLGSLLRLTLLAPDVVEAILDARHPAALGLRDLLEPLPYEWPSQRTFLESASREHAMLESTAGGAGKLSEGHSGRSLRD